MPDPRLLAAVAAKLGVPMAPADATRVPRRMGGGDPVAATNAFTQPGQELPIPTVEADRQRRVAAARAQMAANGVTDAQREAGYTPLVSRALEKHVAPDVYDSDAQISLATIPTILQRSDQPLGARLSASAYMARKAFESGKGQQLMNAAREMVGGNVTPAPDVQQFRDGVHGDPASDDAWSMYLGLPQKHGAFDVSDYRPSRAQSDEPYLTLKDLWPKMIATDIGTGRTISDADQRERVRRLLQEIDAEHANGNPAHSANFPLGTYTIDHGRDARGTYLSAYDKWDLDYPGADHIGHPLEIYDRQYYDPATYRPVPPAPTGATPRR